MQWCAAVHKNMLDACASVLTMQYTRANAPVSSATCLLSDKRLYPQVLLQPRCLLVVKGQAYSSLLHSIPSQDTDVISR